MLNYNGTKYLDYEESAEVLHSAKSTIYALVSDGVLKAEKIGRGRKKYIAMSELSRHVPTSSCNEETGELRKEETNKKEILEEFGMVFSKLSDDNRKVSDNQLKLAEHYRSVAEPFIHSHDHIRRTEMMLKSVSQLVQNMYSLSNDPNKGTYSIAHAIDRMLEGVVAVPVPNSVKEGIEELTIKWIGEESQASDASSC